MPNVRIGRLLQFSILLLVLAAHLTTRAQNDFEWTDASGNTRNLSDLEGILRQHRQWVEAGKISGIRADLHGAWLDGANLSGANLRDANLSSAFLSGANLSGAFLNGANLSGAWLDGANLSGADLGGPLLRGANLSGAYLFRAFLSGANLSGANLNGAWLSDANLSGANLIRSNLNGAWLDGANLSGADLSDADLSGADVFGADLARADFEPRSLPELRLIAAAESLELLTYNTNPDALVQLRKQFEDGGFREQERKITYAIKRQETELSCKRCTSTKLPGGATRAIVSSSHSVLANCGSFVLNKVFFDWTCQYGMSPGRPLILGLLLWLLCSVLYFGFMHTSGHAGLHRVYGQTVGGEQSARRRVERISIQNITRSGVARLHPQFFWRECLLLRTAMFFSLMSAFNIGFRDINFGRWLRLLTRQEFDMKAVGWARVVAGWQSLISMYLIALWVLSYFGRPFG